MKTIPGGLDLRFTRFRHNAQLANGSKATRRSSLLDDDARVGPWLERPGSTFVRGETVWLRVLNEDISLLHIGRT